MRPYALLFTCLLSLVLVAPSSAQDAETIQRFRELNREAVAAYQKKDWPAAIEAFESATALIPEKNALYNLACCYALAGRPDEALNALNGARRAGFANRDHALKDEDLKSLRDLPRFKTIVDRMKTPRLRDKNVDPAATREIPPFLVPKAKDGVTYHRFIAFGDWGTGSRDQRLAAEAMARRAASDKVDFIITTGDNFYGDGVKSVDDPQWKTKWKDVYKAKSLQIPWRPTLGNHDHKGNIQAQVEFSKRDPLWQMPATYYTYTKPLGNGEVAQFFAIDTDFIGMVRGKQKEWLDAELGKSKARWKIVYGHHPLYSHSKRPYNGFLIQSIEKLLVKHEVDLYLAGHDHTLEMLKPVKGVNYVVTGAGGGPSKSYRVTWTDKAYYAATLGGFVLCRVSASELVIEFVRMNGETQYAHTLYKGRIGPF